MPLELLLLFWVNPFRQSVTEQAPDFFVVSERPFTIYGVQFTYYR